MLPQLRPAVAMAMLTLPVAAQQEGTSFDFGRDIRPILSDNCFACHGNDAETREADLRLDLREEALRDLGGYAAIVPGDVGQSEMAYRIATDDHADLMPPPESGKSLEAEEIALLQQWIAAGAPYEEHWSLVAPVRPPIPLLINDFTRQPIDAFVHTRLAAEGMSPSPEADRRTLIRRLSFDLTGLPPSPEEVAAFIADERPDAYEHLVDRLLASPRYAERMAMEWLDAARYADTNGYHIDNERTIWPWRDWLIGSFARNQPFDQFTIESLAGDLLPEPTRDQLVATGFHRNHMINFEGGAIAEEYLNEYVVDRVNTTAKVWLGLTMDCAQCHDHKYDPVSQEEYYRMYAFFNTIDEKGLDGQEGNADPKIAVPTPEQERALVALEQAMTELDARQSRPDALTDAAQRQWEEGARRHDLAAWQELDGLRGRSDDTASSYRRLADGSLLAEGPAPEREVLTVTGRLTGEGHRVLRLQAIPDQRLPTAASGRAGNGNFVLSELTLELRSTADPEQVQVVRFAEARADHQQPNYEVAKAIDGDLGSGWAADAHNRREGRVAYFLAEAPFGFAAGAEVTLTLSYQYGTGHSIGRLRLGIGGDAQAAELARTHFEAWESTDPVVDSRGADPAAWPWPRDLAWTPRPEMVDGVVHPLEGEERWFLFRRTLHVDAAREVTWSLGSDDGILLWLDDELIHDNRVPRAAAPDQDRVTAQLSPGRHELRAMVLNYGGPGGLYFRELAPLPLPGGPVLAALHLAPEDRDEAAAAVLRADYRRRFDPAWAARQEQLETLGTEQRELEAAIPTTMVMREARMDRRRTYVLDRGDYDSPTEAVLPGVPAALPPLPLYSGVIHSRRDLAEWLVSDEQPLTPRVIVNRYWAMLFGRGLVATPADFGSQGSYPSHPELLDWLAVEFRESGWDTRALLKTIVMSATYRQDSRADAAALARDPGNLLLARGPRFRLSAEMVRDQALAASGLLVEKVGGPSVKPYQPPGLWREVAYGGGNSAYTAGFYEQGSGEDLWRRSMYTFRKRSSPPPALQVFDAPNREVCMIERGRTNTPLQALVTLNDPTFLEAARVLAEHALRRATAEGEIAGFAELMLRCTSRPPTAAEVEVLADLLAERRAFYTDDPEAAAAYLEVGEAPRDMSLDEAALAAWAGVAGVVLNLDETLTRG
jgi:hypothetical protein